MFLTEQEDEKIFYIAIYLFHQGLCLIRKAYDRSFTTWHEAILPVPDFYCNGAPKVYQKIPKATEANCHRRKPKGA